MPSLRNSGLEAMSKGISRPRFSISATIASLTFSQVPTGTVDFTTTTRYFSMHLPMSRATLST